jgi:hypothetical protein
MVAIGTGKFNDITFEDIRTLLARNTNLRKAVIRLLAQEHSADLIKAVKIVPSVTAAKKSARKR